MSDTRLPRGPFDQVLVSMIETALNDLEDSPLAFPVVVTQAIGTTDTRVYHGLGQAARYYFIARSSADVRVFDGAAAETTDPANYISLRASTAATVTLVIL